MRSSCFGLVFTLAALVVTRPATAQQAAALRPMTLTYQVLVQGNPMGTVTTALTREGEQWVATSTAAGGMSQESEVRFLADLTPVSSHQRMSQGPISIEGDLRFAQGRVTGSTKLPVQLGGDRQVDAAVAPGTLLPEMDAWYLASATLEPGKSLTIPQFNLMTGGTVSPTYTVRGTESVTVPAGTFEAYRLEVGGVMQSIVLFVRKDAPHIVLKQEIQGQPVSVVLQSVK